MNEGASEWVGGRMSDWGVNGGFGEWVSWWVGWWVSEWMHEWVVEWINNTYTHTHTHPHTHTHTHTHTRARTFPPPPRHARTLQVSNLFTLKSRYYLHCANGECSYTSKDCMCTHHNNVDLRCLVFCSECGLKSPEKKKKKSAMF